MNTLKNINQNNLLSDLIKEISNNTRNFELQNQILSKLTEKIEKQEFTIAVLGTWNSGKSTLLNRILFDSKEVLPIADEPTTSKITCIKYGETPSLNVIEDGEREKIADTIETIIEKLKEVGTAKNEKDDEVTINQLDLIWNSDVLKSGVIAVDTPGLEDVNIARSQLTKKYIDFCDAVIIITTLQNPLTEELKTFLEKKVFIKNAKKIFFLINKCDRFDPEDEEETPEEMREYIAEQIKEISEDKFEYIIKQIFPVSAKTGEGLDSFEDSLVTFLKTGKEKAIVKSVSNDIDYIISELEYQIEKEENSIKCDKNKLENIYKKKEVALKNLDENSQKNLSVLRDDFNKIKPDLTDLENTFQNIIDGIAKIKDPGAKESAKNIIYDKRDKKIKELLENCDIEDTIKTITETVDQNVKNSLEKFIDSLENDFQKLVEIENVLLKNIGMIKNVNELNTKIGGSEVGVAGSVILGGGAGLYGAGLFAATTTFTPVIAGTAITSMATSTGILSSLGATSAGGWLAANGFLATSTSLALAPIGLATGGLSIVAAVAVGAFMQMKKTKKISEKENDLKKVFENIKIDLKSNIKENLDNIYDKNRKELKDSINNTKEIDRSELQKLKDSIENKKISDDSQKVKVLIPTWREKLNSIVTK